MENLFKPHATEQKSLTFWAAIGPVFLTCALSAILLRISSHLWPLMVTTLCGLGLTWWWGRRGLLASFISLVPIAIWQYPLFQQQSWSIFFLASIASSWVLILLGRQEVTSWIVLQLEKLKTVQSQLDEEGKTAQALRQQIQVLQESAREKEQIFTREQQELKFAAHFAEEARKKAESDRMCLQETIDANQEELSTWMHRSEALAQQLADYQSKEQSLLIALEDVHSQLIMYKFAEPKLAVNPVVSQDSFEEKGEEPPKQFLEMQMLYRQLKEQFNEKSELLLLARKELFYVEGQLIALQKEQAEASMELSVSDQKFHHHLDELSKECCDLEQQVMDLEKVISNLLTPKKTARPRKAKVKKNEPLPEILEQAIKQQFSLLE